MSRRINRGTLRRAELKADADERRDARATRSNEEQIALLDSRLGVNDGAKRERARLSLAIDKSANESSKKSKSKSAPEKSGKVAKSKSERRKAKARRNAEKELSARDGKYSS